MIIVKQLTKYFGEVKAVDRVSFEVPAGGSLAVLGPSGSGKTTLLRLIAGLETPDEGEIHIDGLLASNPGWVLPPHQRSIGFVFQTSALWPHMTVAQNIMFGLQNHSRHEARKRLKDVLENTSLTGLAGRYPDEISGGEARRVAIARSIAPRPKYLLMDEPLVNLDSELKEEMLSLIHKALEHTKTSLIYVTHDFEEVSGLLVTILKMNKGKLNVNLLNKG